MKSNSNELAISVPLFFWAKCGEDGYKILKTCYNITDLFILYSKEMI